MMSAGMLQPSLLYRAYSKGPCITESETVLAWECWARLEVLRTLRSMAAIREVQGWRRAWFDYLSTQATNTARAAGAHCIMFRETEARAELVHAELYAAWAFALVGGEELVE